MATREDDRLDDTFAHANVTTHEFRADAEDKESRTDIFQWIHNVNKSLEASSKEISHHINLQGYREWGKSQEICDTLCKLLVNPSVSRILVPASVQNAAVGKCTKSLLDNIFKDKCNIRNVELWGYRVDLRKITDIRQFTNKIQSSWKGKSKKEVELANYLKDIVNGKISSLDPQLFFSLKKALKYVKRKCNVDGELQPNEPHENTKDEEDKLPNSTKIKEKSPDISKPTENKTVNHMSASVSSQAPSPFSPDVRCQVWRKKKKSYKCYICKHLYSQPRRVIKMTPSKKQYPRLCGSCADINFAKRSARTDLKSKYAIVTGGRIKIGYETVLKLLRDGCNVIATTRFPHNAAKAYAAEKDYNEWKDQLSIYPLDFKDIAGVYKFVRYVKESIPHLDIIINNAAQTLRRPMDFYRHILDYECIPFHHLPPIQQTLLATKDGLSYGTVTAPVDTSHLLPEPKILMATSQLAQGTVSLHVKEKEISENTTLTDSNIKSSDDPNVAKPLFGENTDKDTDVSGEDALNSVQHRNREDRMERGDLQPGTSISTPFVTEIDSSKDTKLSDHQHMTELPIVEEPADEIQSNNGEQFRREHTEGSLRANNNAPLCYNLKHGLQQKDCQEETSEYCSPTIDPIGEDMEEDIEISPKPSEFHKHNRNKEGVSKCGDPRIRALNQIPQNHNLKRSNSDPSGRKRKRKKLKCSESPVKPFSLTRSNSQGPLCAVSSPDPSSDMVCHSGSSSNPFNLSRFFPRGLYADDGQQLDLRRNNSWRAQLEDVSLGEFMEVFVVNAVVPFIINKELKGIMKRSPAQRKFIVNVSAMEGQFNRKSKTKFHPHTNMAKAALNMMTRTSALEYKESGIYMTSVDTGWVTDERPFHMAKHEKKVKGFKLPLDCIDGASRVCDPIVTGYNEHQTPYFAVFLKDYKPYPW